MSNDFYYCYSTKLHDYLRENGQRYICAGLNENTMRKFWQYGRTDELNTLLDAWSASNPNR
jgi:hypothetical protein